MQPEVWILRGRPQVGADLRRRVQRDYERFATQGWPAPLADYVREEYGLDLTTQLCGLPLRTPWGKGSGQLSLNLNQIRDDVAVGLGYSVLKTVIAEDAGGDQSMAAWAIREAKMVPERIVGQRSGQEGWTITWKGRGWWQSFAEYCQLVRESAAVGWPAGMPVIPSCKYHLPGPGETAWRDGEYRHTTQALAAAVAEGFPDAPFCLEKDFSPTLAGSDRVDARQRVRHWLTEVTPRIRAAVERPCFVGLKLFNTLDTDDVQLEQLETVAALEGPARPDFVTYANRMFDPNREFEGVRGVAYGGPDLSERNFALLDRYRARVEDGLAPPLGPKTTLVGTGDVHSGRTTLEYVLRGCSSVQIHTYFQLPANQYVATQGSKVAKALHELLFHPEEGLCVWSRVAAEQWDRVGTSDTVQLAALVGAAASRSP